MSDLLYQFKQLYQDLCIDPSEGYFLSRVDCAVGKARICLNNRQEANVSQSLLDPGFPVQVNTTLPRPLLKITYGINIKLNQKLRTNTTSMPSLFIFCF